MSRSRRSAWHYELVLAMAAAIALVALSLWLQTLWPLLLGVSLYLGWHLSQLAYFLRAANKADFSASQPPGMWGEIWRMARRLEAAEHKLRKKIERFDLRFRDAAAEFPDALVALSRSHNVRWCNSVALELLFGRAHEEIVGNKLSKLIATGALPDYLATGEYDAELVLAAPTDHSRVLSIRVLPFGRKKHQLLLIGSDITRTYHLDAARRDFVANVSHELRTPLTVITGYLEPLAEQLGTDPEWARSLHLMQQQAGRMRQMIDDLTLLSRLESEEKPRHDETIAISTLIDDVLLESRALAVSAAHTIGVEADDSIALCGDRVELRSVLSNLLLNALRHTPAGTHVRIAWQRSANGAVLEVSDNGPGIDAEHLPRLTERFYRVDPARARSRGGSGLGLAIVKHVLSRHDAQLVIASTAGHGSRFSCEFPPSRLVRTAKPATRDGV